MPLVVVEPEAYAAASAVFGAQLADGLGTRFQMVSESLSGCGSMAGTDRSGQAWAAAYDPVAAEVTAGRQDVVNGCYRLGALLAATGFNHGAADAASIPGGPPDGLRLTVDRTDYDQSVLLPAPPPAAGGTSPAPPGWWLVQDAVGYLWPNGHQDRLHTAAEAWTSGAESISELAGARPRRRTELR